MTIPPARSHERLAEQAEPRADQREDQRNEEITPTRPFGRIAVLQELGDGVGERDDTGHGRPGIVGSVANGVR